MQIIIPMSGQGARFKEAGYKDLKPLIPVDGKPIIAHVLDRFPGEHRFVFICNREHLEDTPMERILKNLKPDGQIVPIDPHKLGPVHAVLEARSRLDGNLPTIVNYCDFSWEWDFAAFSRRMQETACDGCVVSYTGFHPHLLAPGLYAGMRVGDDDRMIEIREKHSFTENKMNCHHSSGTYYFKTGDLVIRYFQALKDSNARVNNEFYVSSVYQLMKDEGLDIRIYNLDYFLQWGTPQDMEEYAYWSRYFNQKGA